MNGTPWRYRDRKIFKERFFLDAILANRQNLGARHDWNNLCQSLKTLYWKILKFDRNHIHMLRKKI